MATKREAKSGTSGQKKVARRKKPAAVKVEPEVEYGLKELEEEPKLPEPAPEPPAQEVEEETEPSPYLDEPVSFVLVDGDTYKCGETKALFKKGRPKTVIDRKLAERLMVNSRFKLV